MGKGSWRCLTLVQWFLKNRSDLARTVTMMECSQAPLAGRRAPSGPRLHEHLAKAARHASSHPGHGPSKLYQFAIPSCERLKALLDKLFDPGEFLSAFGIRSLSRYHEQHPYVWIEDQQLLHLLQNEWNVVEPYDDQGSSKLVCLIDYLSTTTSSGSSIQ